MPIGGQIAASTQKNAGAGLRIARRGQAQDPDRDGIQGVGAALRAGQSRQTA